MSSKMYFVKVSYTDPDQPLRRIHENFDDVYIDSQRGIVYQVEEQLGSEYKYYEGFTVDFMLCTEET